MPFIPAVGLEVCQGAFIPLVVLVLNCIDGGNCPFIPLFVVKCIGCEPGNCSIPVLFRPMALLNVVPPVKGFILPIVGGRPPAATV